MEKKRTIITVVCVLAIFIGVAAYIVISGIVTMDGNYVLVEVNPKMEFVTNRNFVVTSYKAVNSEASSLIIQENFIGLDVKDAVVKFIDLCARANYIDVESEDNAIKLTVVDGITQALDTHIVQSVHKYLKNNEIMCAVIENPSDLNTYKAARKYNMTNLNKYKLIDNIIDNDYSTLSYNELKKLSEDDLIEIVKDNHKTTYSYTEEELTNKVKLLDFNRERFNNHIAKINSKTSKEFNEKYDKFQKTKTLDYKTNFDKKYDEWYKSKQSVT